MRNQRIFRLDILLTIVTAYASFTLRLENLTFSRGLYWSTFMVFACAAIFIVPFIFWRVGLYKRLWRYASGKDLLRIVVATTVAAILTGIFSFTLTHAIGILPPPRSVPFNFLLLLAVSTAVPRLVPRLLEQLKGQDQSDRTIPILIFGAGDAGAIVLQELQSNPNANLRPVGFVDDDVAKQNLHIRGVPVLGTLHDIEHLVTQYNVQQVIIAMPSASGKVIREITHRCERLPVLVRTVPSLHELVNGSIRVNQLRSVQIEDLLRREPVQTDLTSIGNLLHGRCVLVTGGGGSIGSELCRQALRSEPDTLIILGHGENSLFSIQNELEHTLKVSKNQKTQIKVVVADIRFAKRIYSIFEEYRPHIVFHAAAHKHVPLMEHNVVEAITNNVLGTKNLLEACQRAGTEHFVLISTDKAVNPTSIMGMSKRVAEMLVQLAVVRTAKHFDVVSFGNVLGSRGSVVLTFKEQIAQGGPVTLTHPEMTRFFMLIPEAVQLVLQAATMGRGGDVFVLDMGEPVKILDLARDLIELSGLQVDQDIEIVYTGIRPGEKLYEELFIDDEIHNRTHHHKIFLATSKVLLPLDSDTMINRLIQVALDNDTDAVLTLLKQIIPETQLSAANQIGI